MLETTVKILKSVLEADPTLTQRERSRLLALLRSDRSTGVDQLSERVPRLIRRAEVARLMSCSLRTVDKLAATGILPKKKLPGRARAAGFLETDVIALLTGADSRRSLS